MWRSSKGTVLEVPEGMLSQLLLLFGMVAQLVSGVLTLKTRSVPVTVPQAVTYAVAASYHGIQRGIDPWELIALARNESDFEEGLLGPDGKDCGMTQTRITFSRYSCKQLQRSPWLAFAEAARELYEFSRSCRRHDDFDRCRLNRYNSGYNYAKSGVHGNYWLRVQCFAEAAKAGVAVGQDCRRVHRPSDIERLISGRLRSLAPVSGELALQSISTDSE